MDESATSSMATKLIENGFNNTRAVAITKEFAVFLLSKSSSSSAIANVLMKSFKCRKKKVPPQCILTFHEALKQYGLGCIKPVIPDLLKSIRPMFEVSDKKVRDAVQDLVVEICRFTGPALFETLLSKLRSAQKKSLEERFEKISSEPVPPVAETSSSTSSTSSEQKPTASTKTTTTKVFVDTWDMLPHTKLISSLPKNFYKDLEASKWKTKVADLDACIGLSGKQPKFETSEDFGDLLRLLRKLIKQDKNVQVVSKAILCIQLLVEGLRSKFPISKSLCTLLLLKYKEKHRRVQSAVDSAMNSIHARCFTLDMMGDEIKACATDKKPDIREKTLHWCTNSISAIATIEMYKKKSAKTQSLAMLSEVFENALGDGNQAIRKAAQSGIKSMRT